MLCAPPLSPVVVFNAPNNLLVYWCYSSQFLCVQNVLSFQKHASHHPLMGGCWIYSGIMRWESLINIYQRPMQFTFWLFGNRKVTTIYRHFSTDRGKVGAVHTVKACGVEARHGSIHLNFGTTWRWVVSFMPWQLLYWQQSLETHWIGGEVGLRSTMDTSERKKSFTPAGSQTTIPQWSSPFLTHYTNYSFPYLL